MSERGAAERHRVVAGNFGALTRGVAAGGGRAGVAGADTEVGAAGWDAAAPVEGWVARDVVRHLVGWLPGFLAGGSDVVLVAGPSVDEDPVGAWRVHAEQVQALLDDPATAGRTFANPHTGEHPLDEAIDRFYTSDVFMHSWDLAAATRQPHGLDEEVAAGMLAGMQPIDAMLRTSGQYGPKVEWPDDAPAVERLMAFVGRDPGFATRSR